MNKRQFLASAALGAASLPSLAAAKPARAPEGGPVLLTVSGDVARSNRGPVDPALDQMMHKQHVEFDKACTFDFATLATLPTVHIKPTLEYDGKPHALAGPLLADVLKLAGAHTVAGTTVTLRAVDGYAVQPTMADIDKYRFILATHIDGAPLALGGLGPLWAVYDADHIPELAARPLTERFGLCPWGTYHIDIHTA